MLKIFLVGTAILGSAATHSFAASISPAEKTEVASTRGRVEIDARKKAWFEQAVTKILEGRTEPLDSDR